MGTFVFLGGGIGQCHIICACYVLVCVQHVHKSPERTVVFNGGTHLFLCLYENTTSHYSFSILIDGTPGYFVGIVWIVDDMDSLFVRGSSVGSLLNIFYPLTRWRYLIRSHQMLEPHGGDFDQNVF